MEFPSSAVNAAVEALSIQQNAKAVIESQGRGTVNLICPSCKEDVVTEATAVISDEIYKRTKFNYYCWAVMLSLILIGCLVPILIFAHYKIIIVLVILLIIYFGLLIGSKFVYNNIRRKYQDIHHSCPNCQTIVGINSGIELLKKDRFNSYL